MIKWIDHAHSFNLLFLFSKKDQTTIFGVEFKTFPTFFYTLCFYCILKWHFLLRVIKQERNDLSSHEALLTIWIVISSFFQLCSCDIFVTLTLNSRSWSHNIKISLMFVEFEPKVLPIKNHLIICYVCCW